MAMRLLVFLVTFGLTVTVYAQTAANALFAIDQNRGTVVDRIMRDWGDAIAQSDTSIDHVRLREMLNGLRADKLLVVSLAGNIDGLLEVLAGAQTQPDSALPRSPVRIKTLGSASSDVTYTPVTPCRLVDTRGIYNPVYAGGAFTPDEIRTYTVQGGNGACLSQLPAGLNPAAIQLQVFGIPTTAASGDIEILPQGSTFGTSATMVYIGNIEYNTVSTTAKVNLANNQISIQVRGGGANLAIDLVGYFKAPTAPILPAASVTLSTLNSASVDTRYVHKSLVGTQFSGSLASGASVTVFTFGYPAATRFFWRAVPTTPGARVQLTSTDIELANDGTYTYYLTVKNTGAIATNFDLQRFGLD